MNNMNWNLRYSNGAKSQYYTVRDRMEAEKPTGHRLADYHDRLSELASMAWPGSQMSKDHKSKAKAIRAATDKGIKDWEEQRKKKDLIPRLFDPDNPPE